MRISDWSSDVCSSDLLVIAVEGKSVPRHVAERVSGATLGIFRYFGVGIGIAGIERQAGGGACVDRRLYPLRALLADRQQKAGVVAIIHGHIGAGGMERRDRRRRRAAGQIGLDARLIRSEEHTSELQSLMRTSYAVFCL